MYSCRECSVGEYTLNQLQPCKQCPTGGKCIFGILYTMPSNFIFKN